MGCFIGEFQFAVMCTFLQRTTGEHPAQPRTWSVQGEYVR